MKFLIPTLCLLLAGLTPYAQDVNTAEALFMSRQYEKACKSIDDAIKEPDGITPYTWILRHKIYRAAAKNNISTGNDALTEGYASLQKAYSMPGGKDAVIANLGADYINIFYDYYTSFINSGSENLNAEKFSLSLSQFKQALDLSAFFYKQKLIKNELDTSIVFYAGYAAMKAKQDEVAYTYFKKLCDRDIAGVDLQIAYGWLCNYLATTKKSPAEAKAVYQKGITHYPNDEYLQSMFSTIAVSYSNPEDAFALYEEKLAAGNVKLKEYLNYASMLYDYLYIDHVNDAVNPAKKSQRLAEIINKALSLDNNSFLANYIMGMQESNLAVADDQQRRKLAAAERDGALGLSLKKTAEAHANDAIRYLEAAARIYEQPGSQNSYKERYKTTIEQLMNLYNFMQQADKAALAKKKLAAL